VPNQTAAPERRRLRRSQRPHAERNAGVRFPRWYWPSFTAPGTIWLLLLFVVPFYVAVSVAFGTVDFFQNPLPVYQPWYWSGATFVDSLHRFTAAGEEGFYRPALLRTLLYVPIASLICLVFGYAIAYYVARHGGRRKGMFLILLISPFWISYLMRIYAWQGLLQDDGFINKTLQFLHLTGSPVNWLQGRPITVVLGLVYGYIPYMILPLYGQLDRVDSSLLEAGRDLGASPLQTFTRVTLPQSRQAILAGLIIVSLPMFGDYFTNDLLGSTKTSMFGNLIDTAIQGQGQAPQAASLVLMLIVLLLIPLWYYLRSTKRAQEAL